LLGAAVMFWVAGFDILYACQDVAFDREHGLHSVPARLGVPASLRVAAACHAVMFALLVGLFFAFLFGFTAALGLGPFFSSTGRATLADYLYFSFCTLSTLGYGDLVPRSDLGRMLAVTEALFGQMYLVTVVALLVSNFGRARRSGGR
jgi:hypothetical protein